MFYHKLKMFILVICLLPATKSLTNDLRKTWFILAYSLGGYIPLWWEGMEAGVGASLVTLDVQTGSREP